MPITANQPEPRTSQTANQIQLTNSRGQVVLLELYSAFNSEILRSDLPLHIRNFIIPNKKGN